jgi:uncharacterized membrane protein YdjX (TVP38/TMEM64 family)
MSSRRSVNLQGNSRLRTRWRSGKTCAFDGDLRFPAYLSARPVARLSAVCSCPHPIASQAASKIAAMKRFSVRETWLLGIVVAVAIVAGGVLMRHPLVARMETLMTALRAAGPIPFFIAMALLPAVGFPFAAFTLIAGPVFGPTLGVGTVVACTILATSINVALSYWIAAYALRPLVEKVLLHFNYHIPTLPPRSAWTWTILVRIIPGPPFFLQSYLLALARVPFAMYMIVSTFVPACYLTATIVLGDGLARHEPRAVILAVVIFLVAGAALHVLRKRLSAHRES